MGGWAFRRGGRYGVRRRVRPPPPYLVQNGAMTGLTASATGHRLVVPIHGHKQVPGKGKAPNSHGAFPFFVTKAAGSKCMDRLNQIGRNTPGHWLLYEKVSPSAHEAARANIPRQQLQHLDLDPLESAIRQAIGIERAIARSERTHGVGRTDWSTAARSALRSPSSAATSRTDGSSPSEMSTSRASTCRPSLPSNGSNREATLVRSCSEMRCTRFLSTSSRCFLRSTHGRNSRRASAFGEPSKLARAQVLTADCSGAEVDAAGIHRN